MSEPENSVNKEGSSRPEVASTSEAGGQETATPVEADRESVIASQLDASEGPSRPEVAATSEAGGQETATSVDDHFGQNEASGGAADLEQDTSEEPHSRADGRTCRDNKRVHARAMPHVHVFGDLAELQLFRKHEQLPDQFDSSFTAYRKLRGFVKRVLPGGAWSVAQYVRAALRSVWTLNTECSGTIQTVELDNQPQGSPSSGDAPSVGDVKQSNPYWSSYVRGYSKLEPSDEQNSANDDNDDDYVQVTAGMSTPSTWRAENIDDDLVFDPPFKILPSTIAIYSPDASNAARHDFEGGITTVELSSSEVDGDSDVSVLRLPIADTEPPSMVLWPRYETIRFAVRQIRISKIIDSLRNDKQDDLGEIPIHKIWESLSPDEREPLETFLSLKSDIAADASSELTSTADCSRMVVLLDNGWCDTNQRINTECGESRYVGYLIVRPGREDWDVWSAGYQFDAPSDVSLFGTRLRLRLGFHNPAIVNPESPDQTLFGIPINSSIARLLSPNKRPAKDIKSPAAVVTTSQHINPNVPPDLVQPVWEISRYKGRTPEVYRLKRAEGYAWREDWFSTTRSRWQNWFKLKYGADSYAALDNVPEDRKQLSLIEWGLSHWHQHEQFCPQWALPEAILSGQEFRHLVIVDLNFGFRRFYQELPYQFERSYCQLRPELETIERFEGIPSGLCKWFAFELERGLDRFRATIENASEATVHEQPAEPEADAYSEEAPTNRFEGRPDWWLPLLKWAGAKNDPTSYGEASLDGQKNRGWIIAILGRQLPTRDDDKCNGCDEWDQGDLWHLLRHGGRPVKKPKGRWAISPLFRDRTIAIVSGNLLRASGAMISHRLSWEHTAVDCLRELSLPRFQPLTSFRHLIIRFGCAGAIHLGREDVIDSKSGQKQEFGVRHLFYDATAKDGFHRDRARWGQVIGANSAFASRILQSLLRLPAAVDFRDEESRIHEGIRQAIVDCQQLYDEGYGTSFEEQDEYRMEYSAIDKTLFEK